MRAFCYCMHAIHLSCSTFDINCHCYQWYFTCHLPPPTTQIHPNYPSNIRTNPHGPPLTPYTPSINIQNVCLAQLLIFTLSSKCALRKHNASIVLSFRQALREVTKLPVTLKARSQLTDVGASRAIFACTCHVYFFSDTTVKVTTSS